MCDKKATQAFTILEMLLALSVWSLFIVFFFQLLLIVKKAHKHEENTPLDSFTKILFYVKKSAKFKVKEDCLQLQSLDTKKTYKISFFEKSFREKDEIFVPIKNLKQAIWYYWKSDENKWNLLEQKFKTTSALKLKLVNKDDVCFEEFIFNTAWPYFQENSIN